MKATIKALAAAGLAALANAASAAPTVTIDSVAQRWPWNNKVDITYTVADGTDMAKAATGEKPYYKIAFTATIDGTEYPIDGSKDIIAKTTAGTHTVTWTNAPSGVRASNCKMGAKLYSTSAYYMIVDLDTGHFAFDGLEGSDTPTATPTASNARYNTDLYKTDRLVLRRVPRTAAADATYVSGYPTGLSDTTKWYQKNNTATNWVTGIDYFIGVFELTDTQYKKVMTPQSVNTSMKPKFDETYATLRNSHAPRQKLNSDSSSISFMERLNAITGLSDFDLPTGVMSEIACRAGTSSDYYYFYGSNSSNANYFWNATNTHDVGGKLPNRWGLYDVAGNGYEMCRDGHGLDNMADSPDPWTPAAEGSDGKHLCRNGGPAGEGINSSSHQASANYFKSDSEMVSVAFRVSFAAQ